ncbi:Ail/Lom family outer membrane beta-barrel protein [Sodalis sp. dw_96]|uniref:Ail/Lom family outer membrane beta-barrel protein n=1 Tax=Sodalis sp. dw_96 TaxID=2719794 RepID=UPI001BD61986|nr:Ail/Lom family outer membrane beta-barrel protein [Sodalis sp. dw_96]
MKKLCLALIACATLGTTVNAVADSNHTVSMGYAQSKIEDGPTLKGVNAKYRFEWDSPVSIISSLTYMGASSTEEERHGRYSVFKKSKDKYLSLSAGPAYRFNEFISLYGLIGANFNRYSDNTWSVKHPNNVKRDQDSSKERNVGFMYGTGIQINPRHDISVDIGYEGSSAKNSGGDRYSINGFNIGVGYRF